MTSRRVALDPTGLDAEAAAAALARALERNGDLELRLVAPEAEALPFRALKRVTHVAADDVLGPDDVADVAVRGRPGLAVRRAVELLAAGEVDAVVSSAPAAALLAAARFLLSRAPGMSELVLARTIRHAFGTLTVLDASGTSRTATALARAAAAASLAAPGPVGLLVIDRVTRVDEERLAALRSVGVRAEPVRIEDALSGEVAVLVTDGPAGSLLIDTARAMAAEAVGPGRIVGLVAGDVVSIESDGPIAVGLAVDSVLAPT